MANKRIDQLPINSNALKDTDLIPIWDAVNNKTEKVSLNTLSNFIDTAVFTGNTEATCISELWVSSISGCSPITIGETKFPQGITVSGESVSTENQTEIFSTQSFNISMNTGDTSNEIGARLITNFKHPSGVIITNSIRFRPSDVTSRDTITYGTPFIVHADYGTVDVAGLGLGPTETIGLTGLTYGTTTVSVGWNGISFSGTVTVIGG